MHDVLAEVLGVLQLRGTVYCQSEINKSEWALQFHPSNGAVFHIIAEGSCWVILDDEKMLLQTGDLLILPHGNHHLLADAPNSPVCSDIYLEHQAQSCLMMRWGDEQPKTTLVCGMFTFTEFNQNAILSLLPSVIYFGAEARADYGLNRVIEALLDEANANRQGKSLLLHRLADILFIQVIRAWLADPTNEAHGWLAGLRDPQIATALSVIHAQPADDWTVEKLAIVATMSRSAFSAKFTELIGVPPLTYITRWRMQLATQLLRDERLSLIQIAETIGYTSDIAFSKAFKREQGDTPAGYRRKYG
ncbi:MAG: AraC family transcriptional regulator [bacterium]|nr:AraC family transcriptional regulator [bacterium]